MKLFLIERRAGEPLPEVLFFEHDAPAAFAELSRRERAKRKDDEVVLFMADSLDALKVTHSRFFVPPAETPPAAETTLRRDYDRERRVRQELQELREKLSA